MILADIITNFLNMIHQIDAPLAQKNAFANQLCQESEQILLAYGGMADQLMQVEYWPNIEALQDRLEHNYQLALLEINNNAREMLDLLGGNNYQDSLMMTAHNWI